MLPDYIAKTVPNPKNKRGPWYANTAPSYAGIFLWIAFYRSMAGGTLAQGSLAVCFAGLIVAGLLCHFLYYLAPAMLGMKTGLPLYVVGSSTFGTVGGYAMPGLLMGLLQIGWFAVATSVASEFILRGLGADATPGGVPFIITGIIWGLALAWVGAKGIQYVAKVSMLLNAIPLIMLLIVFFQTAGGIGNYHIPAGHTDNFGAFTAMIAIVIGFFATAGAAGADFGMNSRNESDVKKGGYAGIVLAVLVAGGLPIASIAGAHGAGFSQGFDYSDVIQAIGGPVAAAMFFLFAIASVPPDLLLRIHCGQQFFHYDSRRAQGGLNHGRRGSRHCAGSDRRGHAPDFVLHHRRRVLWTYLRRHGGRLPALRKEMGRTARRREFRWIYCLGSRLRGRDSALPAATCGNPAIHAARGALQLYRGVCSLLGSREGRLAAEKRGDGAGRVAAFFDRTLAGQPILAASRLSGGFSKLPTLHPFRGQIQFSAGRAIFSTT